MPIVKKVQAMEGDQLRIIWHLLAGGTYEQTVVITPLETRKAQEMCGQCGHARSEHKQILDPEVKGGSKYFGFCYGCEQVNLGFPATHHDFKDGNNVPGTGQ